MTIIFEPLTDTVYDGTATGLFLLLGSGNSLLVAAGDGQGDGAFWLLGDGLGEMYDSEVDPELPSIGDGGFLLTGEAFAGMIDSAEADGEFTLHGEGYGAAPIADHILGFAEGSFILYGAGLEISPLMSYGFLMEQDAYVTSYGGMVYESYLASAHFGTSITDVMVVVMTSAAHLADSLSYVNRLHMTLTSSATASAVFAVLLEAQFLDGFVATDTSELMPRSIIALADQLVATGEVTSLTDALITITAAFALRDAMTVGQDMSLESVTELLVTLDESMEAMLAFIDDITMLDEVMPNASIFALFADTLVVTPEVTSTTAALVSLLDEANFQIRLNLPGYDGGLFVGYAMNLRNAGVTEYDNFPFTSFAVVGGKALGTGPDGLYELGGDTDDGEPIAARVRTGLSDFGTAMLKHLPNAYIGYTSNGALVLKVTTTDKGRKKENWYRLTARETTAPVENRFDVAKGLVGLYWGFEIANMDGADFELDAVKVWPLALQRRKSGR